MIRSNSMPAKKSCWRCLYFRFFAQKFYEHIFPFLFSQHKVLVFRKCLQIYSYRPVDQSSSFRLNFAYVIGGETWFVHNDTADFSIKVSKKLHATEHTQWIWWQQHSPKLTIWFLFLHATFDGPIISSYFCNGAKKHTHTLTFRTWVKHTWKQIIIFRQTSHTFQRCKSDWRSMAIHNFGMPLSKKRREINIFPLSFRWNIDDDFRTFFFCLANK